MERYFINKDTLMIQPINNHETHIYELDRSFIIQKNSMEIIKESCSYFGSSYEGRVYGAKVLLNMNYKLPIIVEEFNELIIFPTCSPRLEECTWIILNAVENYTKNGFKTTIEFKNKIFIDVDISFNILENQVFRSTILLTKIHKRKNERERV